MVKDSAVKFSVLVDTVNVFNSQFSKFKIFPKFGPQGGSNFPIGPYRAPPGGCFHAYIPFPLVDY